MNNLNLYNPAEGLTHNSALLLWDKLTCPPDLVTYRIFIDDTWIASTSNTDYTLTNLLPETEYQVNVQAVAESTSDILSSGTPIVVKTKPLGRQFDVRDFGAVGDGMRLNTAALQSAIDACVPGGTVYVPAGKYLSGALFLKGDMTLFLDEGAEIIGSCELADYPVYRYRYEGREHLCYASLINMPQSIPEGYSDTDSNIWKNVSICGKGTINASGASLISKELASGDVAKRGNAVCLRNTTGIYLYGITIREAPFWCLHTIYSKNITMNQIHIENRRDKNGNDYGLYNGDGIDPDSCSNVNIVHSCIESQDDCIAIKSGRDEEGRVVSIPSRNYRISNCRFMYGFGVGIGSEVSAGASDVLVQDCQFINSFSIGSVKVPKPRGGVVERITYDNCTLVNHDTLHSDCRWFRGAIYIDQFYGIESPQVNIEENITEATPTIRDITFKNIELETVGGNAIYICGLLENPLKGIVLQNVVARGIDGMKIYNTDGIVLDDVSVKLLPK